MKNTFLLKVKLSLFALLCVFTAETFSQEKIFWNPPEVITKNGNCFPKTAENSSDTYVIWQEVDKNKEEIWLSSRHIDKSGTWHLNERFAGPFEYYTSEIPDLFSTAITENGNLAVAVQESSSKISVYVSKNQAASFVKTEIPFENSEYFAPRIYAVRGNKFVLFVSRSKVSNAALRLHEFYINHAVSDDGIKWSQFTDTFGASMPNSFAPFMCTTPDKDYLVFQSQFSRDKKNTYQLYLSVSENKGKSWSQPLLVTGDDSVLRGNFADYDNQAPYLCYFEKKVHLVWERKVRGSENTEIWYEVVNPSGVEKDSADTVSSKGKSRKPSLFVYKKQLYSCWSDNRSGYEQASFARKDRVGWTEQQVSAEKKASSFISPVISNGILRFIWQEKTENQRDDNTKLVLLNPDLEVLKPVVIPDNFQKGGRFQNKKVSFRIKYPSDISGIEGYSYSWSRNENDLPARDGTKLAYSKTLSLNASEEGSWYLSVSLKDRAGNWSEAERCDYYLDLTPPEKIAFEEPVKDAVGFLSSNSSVIRWNHSKNDSDIKGYVYKLTKIASVPYKYCSTPRHKTKVSEEELSEYALKLLEQNKKAVEKQYKTGTVVKNTPVFTLSNNQNGVYVLSVAAVDFAGHTGPAENIPLLLNKYVPQTVISGIKKTVTPFGELSIEILGNDFAYDGIVSSVFIDSDGKAPYDLVIDRKTGGFKVENTRISGINLGHEIEEGSYYVGVIHSSRGLTRTRTKALSVDTSGTVQIENSYEYVPLWRAAGKKYSHSVFAGAVILVIALIFALTGTFVFGISFLRAFAELCSQKKLLKQLETGALMQESQNLEEQKKRNGSLKTSLAGFAISLVVAIIIFISLSLGFLMIKEQERTLSKGLHDRVDVLLTSVFTGARTYLQNADESSMEFNDLLNQMSSLSEAEFLTITGNISENAADRTDDSILYVWASNDRNIQEKVTKLSARKTIIPGISKLSETQASENEISRVLGELNQQIVLNTAEITGKIAELKSELANSSATSKRLEISEQTAQYRSQLQKKLLEMSVTGSGSVPEFSDGKLNRSVTEYLFYRPVLYSSGSSEKYVQGILFLKVNTDSLIRDVEVATRKILYIVLVISIITVVIGILVAEGFAARIVKPIQMLEKTVTDISEENDKERLLAGDITDLPNNEIGRLGDSVNRMKKSLGYNERELNLQANEATPIQQSMVSLEPLAGNFKQNISRISDKNVNEFAYYKGASGASGDYFDFKKLDDRWYVLIKCDASGHAAPAGILVTMVATLYKKYFENWSYAKNGTKLDDFVYKVNDFLESLNIKGKFVAMIICLYDSKTGDVYMSHAGDRLVRVYDSTASLINKMELFETPAAGPFPSFMLQMKGGFKVEKTNLKQKDVLLLYTDGIEENGRVLRTADFQAIMKPKTDSNGNQITDEYGNLQYEPEKEEFGEERVSEIVTAVFQKKKYILTKEKNPSIGENLEFDFTNCQGTVEEAVLALSSIEKLFRLYKPHSATAKDLVEVDRAIDGFLKDHFSLYAQYAVPPTEESFNGRPVRSPKNPNNVYYAFMKEDMQDDDLTIVCLQHN